jgi:hypothetical protein
VIIGITLHKKLEQGLDNDVIVIIPIPPREGERTRWKYVLVDKEKAKKVAIVSIVASGTVFYKWEVRYIQMTP